MPVVLVLALGSLLLQVAPAGAVPQPGRPPTRARVRGNTEMTVGDWYPGQGVTGFIADADNSFDPVNGYPASDPTTGFTPKDEGFAGVIHGRPIEGGATLNLYCIDINTDTWGGIGYALGSWGASNVKNVGYVARILNEYYPHTNEPATLANGAAASDNERAAAVQAAIWFFSDRYVLNTSDTLHNTVAAITAKIISEGPLVQPPPPTLTVTPATVSGAHRVLGPFTVSTDAPAGATVTATGAEMFADRAGTMPIAPGTTVPSGQTLWLRSSGPSSAVLEATSEATVPTGNVYLYDGNTADVNDAQRLILAEGATLKTTVQATAEFLPSGDLVVQKTIAGAAAGSQGQVVVHVGCDDGVARRDFVISAGTPAGTQSRTYRHIAAGTTCTVIETSNGAVVGTDVVVTGDGQQVTIPAGGHKTVNITDTYSSVPSPSPSSLLVTKTIAGPLAGYQGPVTISVVCNGTAQLPDFIIAAGTPAGSYSQSFGPVPAGSVCTVSETADGATDTIAAIVSGNNEDVTVPAGEAVPVNLMDVYERGPSPVPDVPTGTLRVFKTIAGPAAGEQGRIAILVACGALHTYAALIHAHAAAGSVSRYFPGIPAGSRCTVTETANGHTSTVEAVTAGRPKTVTIGADRTTTVHLTDTFLGVSAVAVTG